MRKVSISLALSVGLALVGCAAPISFPSVPEIPSPQVQPKFEPGDLVLRLRIGDSRTLQAGGDPVVVHNVEDVAYLVILPFIKEGETFVPMSSAGKPTTEEAADRLKVTTTDRHQTYFVFKNLPPDQTYRFQARAYDAQHNLISWDADSVTDVTFTRVEYANTPTLQLKLKDKPFTASARANVSFADELNGTDHVMVTLFKKGTPDVMVGGTVRIDADKLGSGRTLLLGGLAPHTTYVLKAEARDVNGTVLTQGSAEWVITNDRAVSDQAITLSFGATVSTYMGNVAAVPIFPSYGAPYAMTRDKDGNLYFLQKNVSCLYKVQAAGVDSAGTVTHVTDIMGGMAEPGIAVDSSGNMFVTITGGIVKVLPNGVQSSFVTGLNQPSSICIDAQDNLFVTDSGDHTVRKITAGAVMSTVVEASAGLSAPKGITLDGAGNLYVADTGNRRIRKVTPAGAMSVFAGTGQQGNQNGDAETQATFQAPLGLAWSTDEGLFVTDQYAVRRVRNGRVTTLAGGATSGSQNGVGAGASFSTLGGVVVLANKTLLLADPGNAQIRKAVHF